MKKLFYLIIIIYSAVCIGCDDGDLDNPGEPFEPDLTVTPLSMSGSDIDSLRIMSNIGWKCIRGQSWCHLKEDGEAGSYYIKVTCESNFDDTTRYCILDFFPDGYKNSPKYHQKIRIEQKKKNPFINIINRKPNAIIEVNSYEVFFDLQYECNIDCEIEIEEDWVELVHCDTTKDEGIYNIRAKLKVWEYMEKGLKREQMISIKRKPYSPIPEEEPSIIIRQKGPENF